MAKTKPGLLGLRAPVTFVTEGWVAHEHNVPLCQKRGEPYAPTGHYDVWLVGKRRVIDAGLAISNKSVFSEPSSAWLAIDIVDAANKRWLPAVGERRVNQEFQNLRETTSWTKDGHGGSGRKWGWFS